MLFALDNIQPLDSYQGRSQTLSISLDGVQQTLRNGVFIFVSNCCPGLNLLGTSMGFKNTVNINSNINVNINIY